ncbi:MAG: UDP-N-acetylmuramate--L-alanine ligase [Alphaproteobacteria bacterium]|nr:UDP-N-acetylmuramate--L-alanine ligase [Alphaproteobacteria bacterium]MBT5389999.1 UDP-N-acetylmuramate--L-alanine ligase [Alphaproteobacteria bacterium]MBT5654201.1 UDP-N-acetylmuramate--L-alanine ligase [Alphaproteobacteria bacterium]
MALSPLSIGRLHFVGIGGIGMSGIAEILHNLGQLVQGSDASESANVKRLKDLGIPIFLGQKAQNIDSASVLVVSSAIKDDNPEIVAAKKRGIPIVHRSEMLGQLTRLKWTIAIAGSHGKTTTTSLVSAVLSAADLDPTVVNGGIINSHGTNAYLGQGDWMVVESDESDGSFLKIPATIGVVTNIDPEHMEYYGSFDVLKKSFCTFVQNIPFYGFAAMCTDNDVVKELIPTIENRSLVTYGLENPAQIRGTNIRTVDQTLSIFDAHISLPDQEEKVLKDVRLSMLGKHNIQNALAAIAIAEKMNLPEKLVRKGLETFSGVKRRFTKVGHINGVHVFDDYAHHPTEIVAVMNTAKEVCKGRVIAVLQPHRYSRLEDLFKEFSTCLKGADEVIVAPVFAAGETPIPNINHETLAQSISEVPKDCIHTIDSPEEIIPLLESRLAPDDYLIFMGAGNITQWAYAISEELKNSASDKPLSTAI